MMKLHRVIFLFSDERSRWTHYFSPKNFKHVFALVANRHWWQLIEPRDNEIQIRNTRLPITETPQMLGRANITYAVECEIFAPPAKKKWYVPVLVPAGCHTFCRLAGGVDVGWSFNPYFFFKKLKRLNGKRNYFITRMWKIDNERKQIK